MVVEPVVLDPDGAAMTIFEALKRGIRTLGGAKRLWLLFYVATTVPAAVLAAAAMTVLWGSLGHSAWAARMAGNFDLEWIGEMIAQYGAVPAWPILAALAGAFAIAEVIYLFLLGGALQLFCAREPFSMTGYFGGCGRNFWRLVRLALVSCIFYALVLAIGSLMAAIGRKIWGEGSEAAPLICWGWFRAAVLLCLLGYVNLVFDYARIRLVAEDSRKAFRVAFGSFGFVSTNFGSAAGLYIVTWAIALALIGVYFGLSAALSGAAAAAILLLFVVRQATVLGRIWSRLLFYAGGVELYGSLKKVRAPEPSPAPEAIAVVAGEAGGPPPGSLEEEPQ
jgi:hypothetical protein